jgi:hypothetical protein
MLYYEELLALVILVMGLFGLYIFMKYKDKGYKDNDGEFIVMPHRHKD